MKKNYFLLIAAFVFAAFTLNAQNLVQNPGMEEWDDVSTPSNWDKAENILKEAVEIHGDVFSASHTSASSTKDLSQDVGGIVGGQQYVIQYYYLDNSPQARTRIWSYWMDANGDYLDDGADDLRPGTYSEDSPDWQFYNKTLIAPATATQFRFEVRVYKQDGLEGGMVYYDDFVLEASSTNNPEPSNYPTDFVATANSMSITLDWTDATGEYLPAAYLIKGEQAVTVSPNVEVPVDGVPETDDFDFSDGFATANVSYGVETFTFTNLEPGQYYHFYIYPYSNSGDNIDYKTDGEAPNDGAETADITIINQEGFDADLGTWTQYSVVGDQIWHQSDFGGKTFAQMSGYDGGAFDNEDWMISPLLNLSDYDSVFFSFETAYNYTGPDLELYISNDYDGVGNPNDFTWTNISGLANWSDGGWNWVESGDVDLEAYLEGNTYLAFKFTSTTAGSATWEVDGILVYGYLKTGIEDHQEVSVSVYPNPANEFVNIETTTEGTVSIFSVNGQLMSIEQVGTGINSINVGNLTQGVYLLKFSDVDGNSSTKKLSVN